MKTDALRLDILKSISNKEACGYEIHRRLSDCGKQVDIGRLYKVLIEMLTEGVLGCRWEKSEKGPEKRVYYLSIQGKKALEGDLLEAINTVHSHYRAYLLNLPNKSSIFEGLAKMIIPKNTQISKIALYAAQPNPMHDPILNAIQNRSTAQEVCLVHSHQTSANPRTATLASLKGEFESLPFKERYLDLLIVEGLPDSKKAVQAIEEWYRVLRSNGTLVVIAPKTLFLTVKDPLNIGDYIEKIEHQNLDENESIKGETLQQLLKNCFVNVQKKEILQMTTLICHELRSALVPPN